MLQLQKIHLPEKTNKQTTSLPFSSILHPDCNTDKYFLCLELFRFVSRKKKSQFKLLTSRWQHQLKLWVAGLKKRNYRNNRRKQKKLISQVLNTKENITVSAVEKKGPTVYHTKVFLTAVKINLSLPLSTSYWHRVMPRNNFDCFFFVLFSFKHK